LADHDRAGTDEQNRFQIISSGHAPTCPDLFPSDR
jgi:hypothetical protein